MKKTTPSKKVVDPRFAKSREYGGVIREIESGGKCPFCKPNFKWHKKPILKKNNGWRITESSWPYKNTGLHLLLIPEVHKESLSDLTLEDLTAVQALANWAMKHFKILGGGLVVRFGDTSYTGATVQHLHFHLIVPKKIKGDKVAQTVRFPIG